MSTNQSTLSTFNVSSITEQLVRQATLVSPGKHVLSVEVDVTDEHCILSLGGQMTPVRTVRINDAGSAFYYPTTPTRSQPATPIFNSAAEVMGMTTPVGGFSFGGGPIDFSMQEARLCQQQQIVQLVPYSPFSRGSAASPTQQPICPAAFLSPPPVLSQNQSATAFDGVFLAQAGVYSTPTKQHDAASLGSPTLDLDAGTIRQRRIHAYSTSTSAEKKRYCAFCRKNGSQREYCESHMLKDEQNRVVCPVLFRYKCKYCGATGESAHTESHCPNRPADAPEPFAPIRSRLMASGKERADWNYSASQNPKPY